MVADHKNVIVVEWYETGKIDMKRMRSVEAVQPQCPTCSAKQGAEMSKYSKAQKKNMDSIKTQKEVCTKFGAVFVEAPSNLKVGISLNVKEGIYPINGMRHPIEGDTSGWYIWAGEQFSEDPDFFVPLHIEHLNEWCPQIIKYLGLAPGWRFLIAPGYEDVWQDTSLLQVD